MVRFIDCEGPGIIAEILKEKGYRITYHNAYTPGLQLIPEPHLHFDLILLMGGPQSVADPSMQNFFRPYYQLVRNCVDQKNNKLIGICLGSQIISKAMGGSVEVGDKGAETGFGELEILSLNDPTFKGIDKANIMAFHLHEDCFTIPDGCKHLLKSDTYPNQMFSFQDRIYGIQAHLEPTMAMLDVWKKIHSNFMKSAKTDMNGWADKQKQMEATARQIFLNIIDKEV
ncbi:type 1 glutamine amidotransferase [Leptospira sp. GIMC2001]|uniref:type 1 glutamine amidotransferase n=1 Tax=Leptospira sp. GIMC2001 TaxID=1513297 RepID=UPI00234A972B|nr:type 1 glutamine amidotransferase [Leptospira sp. GIMC2001]WCL49944.1 type 1 glutamine amidotransferase [Leptospira sp. GIMC2001]